MLDQNTFTETIREVSEIIRTTETPLSREEILQYFDKMELNENQKNMVLDYLSKAQPEPEAESEESEDGEEAVESIEVNESEDVNTLPDSPVFQMYLEEIQGLSLCTDEELSLLYEELWKGNASAIERISENWMLRILEQAKKLSVAAEDFSDVIQEGNMALFMKLSELCGAENNVENPVKIGEIESMLHQAVEAAMKNYLQGITGEDDVENAVVGKVTLVNEARKYLMEENSREPSLQELSKYTKMSVAELREMMDLIQRAEQRQKDRG
jgi:RNA polymerase primary sigma factor